MASQPGGRAQTHLACVVNGDPVDITCAGYKTLLEVLREDLGLTGTKHGCELGECGACAVLVDGEPVLSCLALAVECSGRAITTVEGLTRDGRLDPLQEAFADLGAAQCGYCTPGILLTARALLDRVERPTRDDIREALSGNLCRCTGYQQIFEAVESACGHAQPTLRRAQRGPEPVEGPRTSACGSREAPEGSEAEPSRRARAHGGGAPCAVNNAGRGDHA
ncbi:MAG TPA: (2Fe-2S)-binding protein [Vicinamibacterales bacterium]